MRTGVSLRKVIGDQLLVGLAGIEEVVGELGAELFL